MARSGLRMMPTSPSSPLKSVGRVFPGTASRLAYQARRARTYCWLRLFPGYPPRCAADPDPSCSPLPHEVSAFRDAARRSVEHRHAGDIHHPTPGASLRSGFYCPGPSTLTWPHRSHSPAQRDSAAVRFIRAAFAVRERLGDRRVVSYFHCAFCLDMPPSTTPWSSPAATPSSLTGDAGLHTTLTVRHSRHHTIRFTWASNFRATSVRY